MDKGSFELDGAGHARKLDPAKVEQALEARDSWRASSAEAARNQLDGMVRTITASNKIRDRELQAAIAQGIQAGQLRARAAAIRAIRAGRDPLRALDELVKDMKRERLAEDAARVQKGAKS